MKTDLKRLIILLLICLLMVSCGTTSPAVPDVAEKENPQPMIDMPPIPTRGAGQTPSDGADPFAREMPQGLFGNTWPDTLPDDIPVLDGAITTVMGDGQSTTRIFYKPISPGVVEQYVDQCRKQSFEITMIVYTAPGFPDDSEERLKSGDYDAIEFKKGEIFMRLEYGKDLATLDIMLQGRANYPGSSTEEKEWPQDIAGCFPQPEGCRLTNIANLSAGGYQLTCTFEAGTPEVNAYIDSIKSMGFDETDRLISDTDEVVYVTLTNHDLNIKLMPHPLSKTFTYQIWR